MRTSAATPDPGFSGPRAAFRSLKSGHLGRRVLGVGLVIGAVFGAGPAGGQDVEMLGRRYGTTPPPEYYRRIAADPGAFRFRAAWTPRLRSVIELREPADGGGGLGDDDGGGLPGSLSGLSLSGDLGSSLGANRVGPTGTHAAVEGTFRFPIVMGLYADTPDPPPFDVAAVRAQLVDGPNPTGTLPDYYREVSGGRVDLVPEISDWERVTLTSDDVTGGSSGLGTGARVGEFISRILAEMEASGPIDWGRYDNDGPDGVPNSGDDDGFVDVLGVIHPTRGAECGGSGRDDRVWSHRWSLSSAYQVYVTEAVSNSDAMRDPGTGEPGRVRIDDYTIQPVRSCNDVNINEIGVFAHELAHGFGLPDLYAVGGQHAAVGQWGLMASGSWGCRGGDPKTPCHMGAWSKEVLGWADVVTVEGGVEVADLLLDPTVSGGPILRVDALDGSGEYFLLENRQGIGFDRDLHAEGLLVWQVSPAVLMDEWPSNRVNSDPDRMGVRIRQADGLNDLGTAGGGRGDDGDIFPGSAANPDFHAGSVPAAWTFDGRPSGLTLTGIERVGEQVRFDLVNRYQEIGVRLQGATPEVAFVEVDGEELVPGGGGDLSFLSAPFQTHTLEARGRGDSELAGVRLGFEGWLDGGERAREWVTGVSDTTLVAVFSGVEFRLALDVDSDYPGPVPGTIGTDPEGDGAGWFSAGTEVVLTAAPTTGFAFTGWAGDLAGRPNPTTVVMDEPVQAQAAFQLVYALAGPAEGVDMEATVPQEVIFEVVNATEPIQWTLLPYDGLPDGLEMDSDGRIAGTPLETGDFPVTLRARDARGLTAERVVELRVDEPTIGVTALTGPLLESGATLTEVQTLFLDRTGNDNGVYDLGDFRSFLIRNPDLPMSAELRTLVRTLIRMEPNPVGEGGGS